MKKIGLEKVSDILLVLGALLWGIVAISDVTVIADMFNKFNLPDMVIRIFYGLVGIAGIYKIGKITKLLKGGK